MTTASIPSSDSTPAARVYALVTTAVARHPAWAGRLDRAAELVLGGHVWHQADGSYYVRSGPGYILPRHLQDCPCADYTYRGGPCKHQLAVGLLQRLEREEARYELTAQGAAAVLAAQPAAVRHLVAAALQTELRHDWAARQVGGAS